MGDPVRPALNGAVLTLWLDRPHVRNAIDLALAEGLERRLVAVPTTVRVVVIRGVEGNFSVGGDFDEVARLREGGPEGLRPLFATFGRALSLIGELEVPVIAAVEGYAMAGGFELLQACDLALVREDAVLADNHANFGQVPGGGGSQRLPRLVGLPRALGHILTGERISGADAVAWGLAYRSASAERFEDELGKLVTTLLAKDRRVLARAKQLARRGLEQPLATGLAAEIDAVVEHLGEDVAGRGIEQFHARRQTF
ncbi:enoyl-CoA hydratase/isomerase family protein [Nitriliruptor alkaliphilus]|uniref:enoyl-CoA hydratase/isomerase family protein n=1 Tax=Nitriliruptor alkaliphilus TaxID=427918 RepID=UPI00069691FE|nr:enoyl-CoA hydratase/isomerase family protein [Nitriliruptor alkaliphilus]